MAWAIVADGKKKLVATKEIGHCTGLAHNAVAIKFIGWVEEQGV